MMTSLTRRSLPRSRVSPILRQIWPPSSARSIKYQLTVAKLPLAKDVDEFTFKNTPINEALVHDLAGGGFIAQQRNLSSSAEPAPLSQRDRISL
jgi:hypothetical protein